VSNEHQEQGAKARNSLRDGLREHQEQGAKARNSLRDGLRDVP